MMAILTALIPALLPAAADGLRGIFSRLTGGAGARPQNVGELIQVMHADTERLQAVAALDSPGGISQWVANIRALQRPAAVVLVLAAYIYALAASDHLPAATLEGIAQYAQMVTFYLFGDRSYSYLKAAR
jgi:hypothetical protein